jgi:hypothetical protein
MLKQVDFNDSRYKNAIKSKDRWIKFRKPPTVQDPFQHTIELKMQSARDQVVFIAAENAESQGNNAWLGCKQGDYCFERRKF